MKLNPKEVLKEHDLDVVMICGKPEIVATPSGLEAEDRTYDNAMREQNVHRISEAKDNTFISVGEIEIKVGVYDGPTRSLYDYSPADLADYLDDFPEDAWRSLQYHINADISKTGALVLNKNDDLELVKRMLLEHTWSEDQIKDLNDNQLICLFLCTFTMRCNPLGLMQDMLAPILTKKEKEFLKRIMIVDIAKKSLETSCIGTEDEEAANTFSEEVLRGISEKDKQKNGLVLARFLNLFSNVFLKGELSEEYIRSRFLVIL